MMKKLLVALLCLLPFQGYGQTTASQTQPGFLSTTGCPSGAKSCFLPYSLTNPLPINVVAPTGAISGYCLTSNGPGAASSFQPCGAGGAFTLTTTGTSGAATFIGGILNIPIYSSSGGGGTLGTSTAATSPQKSGDATTGLFSAAAGTVSTAAAGVDVLDATATGVTTTGTISGNSTGATQGTAMNILNSHDANLAGGAGRVFFLSSESVATGAATSIDEGFFFEHHLDGAGSVNKEENGVHSYIQVDAGRTNSATIEQFESSFLNNGTVNADSGNIMLQHNGVAGTIASAIGYSTSLTNDNTTAASIGQWTQFNCVPMSGAGTLPTHNYCLLNSDPTAGINTAGGMVVGKSSVVGTNNVLTVIGTAASTFPLAVTDVNSNNLFFVRELGTGGFFAGTLQHGNSTTAGNDQFFNGANLGSVLLQANTSSTIAATISFPITATGTDTLDVLNTAQTFGAKKTTAASTTTTAGFNLPQGTAPTSPVNGDLWATSSGVFAQIAGATVGPFGTGGGSFLPLSGGTLTGELITETSGTANAPLNIPPGSAPTSPANGDMWTTSAGVFARVAGATVGPFASGGSGVATVTAADNSIVANTTSGNVTLSAAVNSQNVAASTPSLLLSGTPMTSGGTGTTTAPIFSINPAGSTQPTTLSTAGTMVLINTPSGFAGNILDVRQNGSGSALLSVGSGGTLNALATIQGAQLVTSNLTGNLYINGGFTNSNATTAGYQFAGSTNTGVRIGVLGVNSAALTAGANYSGLNVGSSPVTTAATGTHNWLANLSVNPIGTVTSGGAAITNTADLYVGTASSAGTNNYSIYSAGPTAVAGNLTTNITGSTQCVQANSAGVLSGTGSACGAGGGGVNPPIGSYVNLAGSAAGSSALASWTADQVVVGTSLSGTPVTIPSVSCSFNGGNVGANGMDTGTMPSTGSLYIYEIWNGTTAACLGTITGGGTIYSGTHFPSGYTYSALISVQMTSGTNFIQMNQLANRVFAGSGLTLAASTSGSTGATSMALTPLPSPIKMVYGFLTQSQSTGVAQSLSIYSLSTEHFQSAQSPSVTAGITGATGSVNFEAPVLATSIWYSTGNTTGSSVNCTATSYTF